MDRILEELARHVDDATRPEVELYLASGPVLHGRVIRVQQGMATVHGTAKDPSVSYVRVEHIIAVTVLSARGASAVEGPRSPSHHDDIITPVNEMSLAAMQAAMATPTPPEEIMQRQEERAVDRASRRSLEELRRAGEERRSSGDMRGDKARADKARAELARAELARADAARGASREEGAGRGAIRDDGRSAMRDDSGARRGAVRDELAAQRGAMREDSAARGMMRDDSGVHRAAAIHGEIGGRGGDDVSAAFSAMRMPTENIPASDPIAEFVASQYDVITPPDPIVPISLQLAAQQPPLEAPTYLGERPQLRQPEIVAPTYLGERPQPARAKTPTPSAPHVSAAQVAAASNKAAAETTFPMRGDTPKPKAARTPSPSRPELMRQAGTHAEMMSRVLKHRVEIAIAAPLDDDSRRAIGHALPIASDVLLAMFGEPKHRPAMERIAQIELVAGDAEVMLDGARLVIRCSLVDRWTPATLRAAIETA